MLSQVANLDQPARNTGLEEQLSLAKEWLMPLARTLLNNQARGPVYALGDQVSWIPCRYATRKLGDAGLLRNPNAPIVPCRQNSKMASFQSILALLGLDQYYDIDLNGRAAITSDFSQPLAPELSEKAGVVIDIGTCEHIFNLPQVFTNIVHLLRPGGLVVHLAPLSWYNHGFVNFNPIFFKEFYEHNQFSVVEHGLIVAPLEYPLQCLLAYAGLGQQYLASGISPLSFVVNDESRLVGRMATHIGLGSRIIFLFAARKGTETSPVTFPCQRIYAQTTAS